MSDIGDFKFPEFNKISPLVIENILPGPNIVWYGDTTERDQMKIIDELRKMGAIAKIKNIQKSEGIARDSFPEEMKPNENMWENGNFSYGMEYGYILCLLHIYNITEEDLQ